MLLALMAVPVGSIAQTAGERPDFSGVWFPQGFAQRTPNPLPFTDGAAELVEAFSAEFAVEDDPGRYCIWPGLPRVIWGAPFAVEIFHRPQDVTVYWEGYGMYRKIYMEGFPAPTPLLNTAMGHSIAHWEGDALVIETTRIDWPYFDDIGTPMSSAMKVVERFVLDNDDRLHMTMTVTDPATFTEPVRLDDAYWDWVPGEVIKPFNCVL